MVSKDFARHFKARLEGKKKSRLPLVAQADFAYIFKLATGALAMPEDAVRQREVLRVLKGAVRGALAECVPAAAAAAAAA